jgi:hypothetical protein
MESSVVSRTVRRSWGVGVVSVIVCITFEVLPAGLHPPDLVGKVVVQPDGLGRRVDALADDLRRPALFTEMRDAARPDRMG